MIETIPAEILDAHVRSFFADRTLDVRRWHLGPSSEMWPELYVLHVLPNERNRGHVFASIGAANLRKGYHREFMLFTADGGEHHVEMLFMTAYYHHHEGLDVAHTFPVGRAWCPGAACDHLLVTLPYLYGPKLEKLSHAEHEVNFLWLMPVYESEVKYRHANGLEALEQLFDQAAFNVYDLQRKAVV